MTVSSLATELHRRMKKEGFNQKSLATAAGLNETYVRDILKGKSKNPEAGRLSRIAAVLGCSITDLLQPRRKDDGQSGFHITFSDDPTQIAQTAEEAEWLGAWRDMNEAQRRRAIALLKAMIDADAA